MQSEKQKQNIGQTRFFLQNLFRGLVWLAAIVGGYFYLESQYDFTLKDLLGGLYDHPEIIFSVFFVSDVVFGIIPPELFMIWALRNEVISDYIGNVAFLAALSYLAGIMGYYIGMYFADTRLYFMIRKNYLGKFEERLNKRGGFLVVVAALTPLPFSGICMLVGATGYPIREFLFVSLARLLRFAVYGAIVWEANVLH